MRDEENSIYMPEQFGGLLRRSRPGCTDEDVARMFYDLFTEKLARAEMLSPEELKQLDENREAWVGEQIARHKSLRDEPA